jgi:hypothetical protein
MKYSIQQALPLRKPFKHEGRMLYNLEDSSGLPLYRVMRAGRCGALEKVKDFQAEGEAIEYINALLEQENREQLNIFEPLQERLEL